MTLSLRGKGCVGDVPSGAGTPQPTVLHVDQLGLSVMVSVAGRSLFDEGCELHFSGSVPCVVG